MSELDEIEDLLKKREKEKAFELIQDKDKNSLADGLIERGSSLVENKEYNFAITYFEFSEKIALDNEIKENARKHLTDAYNNRGLAYYDLRKYNKAIKDYNKAIELNSNFAMAYSNRGLAYYRLNRYDEAIEDCNKAIELDPNAADAYKNRGVAYYGLKKYEEAIEDYNKAIELDPKYVYAYNNRGVAYRSLKKYEEAIEDYNKAIELDPKYAYACSNRGNVYSDIEKYEEAIEDYNKAIELDPKYVEAYYNRGNAYHDLKRYNKAIEDCNKAIELDRNAAYAYHIRGRAYYYLKKYEEAIADYNKAIENYNKAIELDPNAVEAYYNRGLTYYSLKGYREAIENYNKAIELNPDFDIAHANLGDSLFMTEDYDNAEKEYREAIKNLSLKKKALPKKNYTLDTIKINKNLESAHNGLGLVLSRRKAYKDAIAEFKKALKLNKDADFYYNLGCVYAEYGKGSAIALIRYFKARNNLRKATQKRNTYIEAHKNLTHVGDLLSSELKIFLFRIFIIFFVFALSINLFEPITINRWILILSGVATLSIVLFSLDFAKIEIKSLKIAGVVEAELKYEKPKAGEPLHLSPPKIIFV